MRRTLIFGPLPALASLALGVASALFFYALARAGYFFLSSLFPAASSGAASVYAAGDQVPRPLVSLALLAISLLEEFYWRGWATPAAVRMFAHSPRFAHFLGLLLISSAYGLVHLSSANPLLLMIAFIAAFYWGALYLRFRSLLVTITSHFIWDVLVFQIAPFATR